MNYTKLITKKKQYKYSVNICLDLRTEERLADFIPNLTTTEIIREYLGGIIRGNSDTHSRILYGSYGISANSMCLLPKLLFNVSNCLFSASISISISFEYLIPKYLPTCFLSSNSLSILI